jgi:4-amino-4-deoxy-L-arabinose transferase-like glycosyltransferase
MAGFFLAGIVGVWAGRWYGRRAGWAAVFVQLTSFWFMIFARKAEIDMLLCLLTTTALFLFADQPQTESSRRKCLRWMLIYGLLSASWLAKFHYGPAMVLAPALVYCYVEKRWQLLKTVAHPAGLVLFALAVVIWPMLVLESAPNAWEIWRRETLGRAMGELGNHPVWYYLPYLLWLPLPWTPFVLASVKPSWKAAFRGQDSKERFLWIWLLSQLAIVTLSANKHPHYLLALFPMFSLLAARSLSALLHGVREGRLKIERKWLPWLLGSNIALSVLLMGVMDRKWPDLKAPIFLLAVTIGVCEGLGWLLLYRRKVLAVVAVNVLSVLIGGVVLVDWFLPRCDRRVNVQAFAEDIRQSLLPTESVVLYRMDRDPLVYHLGTPVFRAECLGDLKPKLDSPGPTYVLGYEKFVTPLEHFGETQLLARLPKGLKDLEPVEGDLVLIKIVPDQQAGNPISQAANAN